MRGLRVKRLIVCGVVGVVAAWGSAWGIQIAEYLHGAPIELVGTEGESWPFRVPAEWPPPRSWFSTEYSLSESTSVVGEIRLIHDEDPISESEPNMREYWAHTESLGWPCRALETRWTEIQDLHEGANWHAPRTVLSTDARSDYTLPIKLGPTDTLYLPLRPVWPGFAVNAAFYAGVCWSLLATPGFVRRWSRRRRGRCAACGYDLSGLEACPECGA